MKAIVAQTRSHGINKDLFKGCEAGQFYNNVTGSCSNCSIGSYSSGGIPLQMQCTQCEGNMTTQTEAATNSSHCGRNLSFISNFSSTVEMT